MEFVQQNWVDYSIVAVYMAVILGIGFLFANRKETTENYLLGGRNMPFLAIGLSMMMTLMSSITIVQVPGEIFNHGWTLFSLGWLALLLQIPCYMLFSRFYFKLGSYTPYEYLEYRYDPWVRGVVAVSAFYTRTMYLGMVLYTTSKIFEGAYSWPCWFTILFIGIIGMAYTVLGGMKAVVWTDVIQFFVFGFGLFAVIWVLNDKVDGGLIGAVAYAHRTGHLAPEYATREFYSITPYCRLLFWLMLWNTLVGALGGAATDQINVQRILSTGNWKAGLKSQAISSVLGLFASLALSVVGFAIYSYYSQNPDPFILERNGDVAFFRFVSTVMPQPIPGIFMAAMLAAIMSTLDSGINSMGTVWLKEIHAKFINRNLTPEKEVSVSRWATFLVGTFAIMLGLAIDFSGRWLQQSVTEVGVIFNMLGAAAFPAFLAAVLSKKANAKLIWAYTFFSFGEIAAKNLWYVLSRASEQAWRADPSAGFGWAGKLPLGWFLVPLGIGSVLCIPWLLPKLRRVLWSKILVLTGLVFLGASESFGMWYFFSNLLISDTPQARSFAFFLPLSLIAVFVILWFCPEQPEKKWRGLTLATVGDAVLERD